MAFRKELQVLRVDACGLDRCEKGVECQFAGGEVERWMIVEFLMGSSCVNCTLDDSAFNLWQAAPKVSQLSAQETTGSPFNIVK